MSAETRSVYDERTALDFDRSTLLDRPDHGTVLLVRSTYFDVRYRTTRTWAAGWTTTGRPTSGSGSAGRTNGTRSVVVLDPDDLGGPVPDAAPVESLPDLVFGANLGVATADGGGVVRAEMATAERASEHAHFDRWCRATGYDVRSLDGDACCGVGTASGPTAPPTTNPPACSTRRS